MNGLNISEKIELFEEIGWLDPELDRKHGMTKVINYLKALDFFNDVYP
jgi:hypothetical protein